MRMKSGVFTGSRESYCVERLMARLPEVVARTSLANCFLAIAVRPSGLKQENRRPAIDVRPLLATPFSRCTRHDALAAQRKIGGDADPGIRGAGIDQRF